MKLEPILREFAQEIVKKCEEKEQTLWASEHGQSYCISFMAINDYQWQYAYEIYQGSNQAGSIIVFLDDINRITYRVSDIGDFGDELYTLKMLNFVKENKFFGDLGKC